MRILQVTGDWKWTGPAAPMLELILALRGRGHEVELACPEPPPDESGSLWARAHTAGIRPALAISRGKGVRWLRDRTDVARLRDHLLSADVDVVHTWHSRDHVLALRAAGLSQRRTCIVRSYKSADPIPSLPWNRWLFGPGCDGLVCVSPGSARRNTRLRGGRPVLGAFGAVDVDRFRPGSAPEALRASLGIGPEHRVVGIVARAQRHRRFDLLLEAARELMRDDPRARLLVIGRGTHIEETAKRPAARLGIADRVVFAGYRTDDYVDVLRCSHVFTFLVPGSDGGCRALLEAAACGLPAVTTARGALPEIVVDGETGLVVPEEPRALAAAWRRLLAEPPLRQRMARAARERAQSHFDRDGLAARLEAFYAGLRAPGPGGRGSGIAADAATGRGSARRGGPTPSP